MRKPTDPAIPPLQLVLFRVGGEAFGLEVSTVLEVLRYRPPVSLPDAPAAVEGELEVRGDGLPVVDLRRRFGVSVAQEVTPQVLVVRSGEERLAVLVDAVLEVLAVPAASVAPPPPYFRGAAAEYIRGIARLEERLIILLDPDRILSAEERTGLKEVRRWSVAAEDSRSA